MFFSDGAWFTLNGNVNSQNNGYWCSENCLAVYEVPVHDLKVRVWNAVSMCKITMPVFFKEIVNSYHYHWLILTPFFRELTQGKMYCYFMHSNATQPIQQTSYCLP
jgi:hypothetical protein